MLRESCSICENVSGYDEESLKGSTWIINGVKIVLCCPCEDDLKKKLNKNEVRKLKEIARELQGIYN